MPTREKRLTDANAVRAAYWVGERGRRQDEVATLMKVSQATVSRLIERAKNKLHCFEEVPRFIRANAASEWLEQIEDEKRYAALAEQLAQLPTRDGRRLRTLHIFDSGSADTSQEGIERRQRHFGLQAAPYLAERLAGAKVIGVAWGSTLSRAIDGLERIGFDWPEGRGPTIVPVSAEPMRYSHNEFTSSTLARRLDGIINSGRAGKRRALTGVPAFIPRDFTRVLSKARRWSREEHQEFHDALRAFFLKSSPAYFEIFGQPSGLIQQVDTLVTSVGASDRPMGFCNKDLLEAGRVTKAKMATLVAGDVGGVLLPKSHATTRSVDRLMSMWTGISREDLDRVAGRAARDGTPGTLVITMGENRVEPLCEALAAGLCTELLLDRDAADALPAALAKRFGTRPS